MWAPKDEPVDEEPVKQEPVISSEGTLDPVIDPDVARREVIVPRIDTENYEVGTFLGVLSVEDLESHPIYGVRAAYHLSEDFFVEAEYGRSEASDQIRRTIGQPFFPKKTVSLDTYGVNIGYNLLPGELFLGSSRAISATMYVLGGAGDTQFNNEHYLTYNAGMGLKLLPTDWLSLRLEMRDRMWESDLLGKDKFTHNFEATLGVAAFF
ncbi:hypothetical protein B1810_05445 [Panacagrimonas perspica]|nr:hypothetical protein B1810_05445 [Panacagrimonas perspica]